MVAPTAEEVRRHLCYELKWMLRAVVRFEELSAERSGTDHSEAPATDRVALHDSALLHARNLIDFASTTPNPDSDSGTIEWALIDILGTKRRKVPERLDTFLNSSVVYVGDLGTAETRWPKDIDGNAIAGTDEQRLTKLAEVVLELLKPKHRTTTQETEAGAAYVELLDRAHEYLDLRTPREFDRITCDGTPMPAEP